MQPFGKRRVVVTGLAIVDPLGQGTQAFFERVAKGYVHQRVFQTESTAPNLQIQAVYCDPFDFKARWGKPAHPAADRYAQLGIYAAREAWEQAGLSFVEHDADAGVMWGTALGGMMAYESGLDRAA